MRGLPKKSRGTKAPDVSAKGYQDSADGSEQSVTEHANVPNDLKEPPPAYTDAAPGSSQSGIFVMQRERQVTIDLEVR